jgi:peptidoglycan/LPS O-acetylase OafA/YrhL
VSRPDRDRLAVAGDVAAVFFLVGLGAQVVWHLVADSRLAVGPLVLAVMMALALVLRRRRRRAEEAADGPLLPSRAGLVGSTLFFAATGAAMVAVAVQTTGPERWLAAAVALLGLPLLVLSVVMLVRYDRVVEKIRQA